MKEVFRFEGLACPKCAKKLEDAILALPGVSAASVNFITGKITIEADGIAFDNAVAATLSAGLAISPDFKMK